MTRARSLVLGLTGLFVLIVFLGIICAKSGNANEVLAAQVKATPIAPQQPLQYGAAATVVTTSTLPHIDVTKTVQPLGCNYVQVQLTMIGSGTTYTITRPLDVIFVIDISGSMDGEALDATKAAIIGVIGQLDPSKDQVAAVVFSDVAQLAFGFTSNFTNAITAINLLSASGNTNPGDGMFDTNVELVAHGRPNAVKVVMLLSDGVANRSHAGNVCADWPITPTVCTQDAINQAHAVNATIFTIGLGLDTVEAAHPGAGMLARNTLTQTISTYGKYYEAPTSAELEGIFNSIITELKNVAATNTTVIDVLPGNVHYVTGTAMPAPNKISGQTITWTLGTLSITDTRNITFQVQLDPIVNNQLVDVFPDSRTEYTNYQGNRVIVPFPERRITVLPAAQFSASSYQISEAGGQATITATLSKTWCQTVTAQYATANGTAKAGRDYMTSTGTLTFMAGITRATFNVSVIDNDIFEGNKTVSLTLSSPSNATVGQPNPATLTIMEDEPALYPVYLPLVLRPYDAPVCSVYDFDKSSDPMIRVNGSCGQNGPYQGFVVETAPNPTGPWTRITDQKAGSWWVRPHINWTKNVWIHVAGICPIQNTPFSNPLWYESRYTDEIYRGHVSIGAGSVRNESGYVTITMNGRENPSVIPHGWIFPDSGFFDYGPCGCDSLACCLVGRCGWIKPVWPSWTFWWKQTSPVHPEGIHEVHIHVWSQPDGFVPSPEYPDAWPWDWPWEDMIDLVWSSDH